MDLSRLFLYSGRFLITFYLIAIFCVSIAEVYYQNSASLSTETASAQLLLNTMIKNINANPITEINLAGANADCQKGKALSLALYETSNFCECNSTDFYLGTCKDTQIENGCQDQVSKILDFNYWKEKKFCHLTGNHWNFTTKNGTCDENMTHCNSGVCVKNHHTCPLNDMIITDTKMPSNYTNLGNLTQNLTVWTTNSSYSTPLIDLSVSYVQNSSCFNGRLILKNDSDFECSTYYDDFVFKTLDAETKTSFYHDNNLTEGNSLVNASNISIFLLLSKKIPLYSDGVCSSLRDMSNLTIDIDFTDFDSDRNMSVYSGIIFPVVSFVLYLIYVAYMHSSKEEEVKNWKSFLFFWILHGFGTIASVLILFYDYYSYDFLNTLDDNNDTLYSIEAAACFAVDIYQNFLTNLVDDIENYYSNREGCMDVGLVFSASYIIFEMFYLLWFGFGFDCRQYIEKKEDEVQLTEKVEAEEE